MWSYPIFLICLSLLSLRSMAQQTSSFQTSAIERRTRGETKAETAVKGETSFKNMPNTRVNQVVLEERGTQQEASLKESEYESLDEPMRSSRKDTKGSRHSSKKSKKLTSKKVTKKRSKKRSKKSIAEEEEEEDSFDFTDCDSFSNDWLFDLAGTCDQDTMEDCECETAEILLLEGEISCATIDERFLNPPACPSDCPVCEFCMVVIGCDDIYQ